MNDKKGHFSMKMNQTIEVKANIRQITRYNNSIIGCSKQHFVEVDIKHLAVYMTEIQSCIKFKYMRGCLGLGHGYYIVKENSITKLKSGILSQTNSLSNFCGDLDGNNQHVIFTKYHKNHNKYSINILHDQNNKQVLKLQDSPFSHIHIEQIKPQIYYSLPNKLSTFLAYKPEQETLVAKNGRFLHDTFNTYLVHGTKIKEVGIYDLKTNQVKQSWSCISSPIKIEQFNNYLIVGCQKHLQIFDRRRLIQPYAREDIKNFNDFYFEPNFKQIYVSSNNYISSFKIDEVY